MLQIILRQEETAEYLPLVESLEQAKELLKPLKMQADDDEGYFYIIKKADFPLYVELRAGGGVIALSSLSFPDGDDISVDIVDAPLISELTGLEKSTVRVDAYHVAGEDAKEYIFKREENFNKMRACLEEMGYKVAREYQGSQDGEAITVQRGSESHFVCHMDPTFVEDFPKDEKALRAFIKELL